MLEMLFNMLLQAWTYSISGFTSSPTPIQHCVFSPTSYLRRVPNKIFPWIQWNTKTCYFTKNDQSPLFNGKDWFQNIEPLLSYMKLKLLRAHWISSLVQPHYLCLSSGTGYNRPTTASKGTNFLKKTENSEVYTYDYESNLMWIHKLTVKWLSPTLTVLHLSSAYGSPPDITRFGLNLYGLSFSWARL